MSNAEYTVLLFYKYTNLSDPESTMLWQKLLCEKLELKGRILISKEGINATVEGLKKNIRLYIKAIEKHPALQNIHYKLSSGDGLAFPKLSIKVRTEIVSGHLGIQDINPQIKTGKYLLAEELHNWFEEKKEFYIVDMRNDYEQQVGYFESSILSNFNNFRDLPTIVEKLDHLKEKTIVTVCTGGVRCEKASGFLVENGFKDVYQLFGGIVTYMEKYPNEHFLGKLYVFDKRIIMGFNVTDESHKMVGKCGKCESPTENFYNCTDPKCHKHFLCCDNCKEESGAVFCSRECKEKYENQIENQQYEYHSQ